MAVSIRGTIVSNDDKWIYDWFEIDATCPKDVIKAIAQEQGDEVVFEINSGGGDLFAGNEIYYLIKNSKKKTRCSIVGLAASSATVIACAADVVDAVPGAQYMIHNVSCSQHGDYNAMDKMSDILKNANVSVSNIYQLKTGMKEKELLKLMNEETWLDAKKAMEYGFIDEIIGDNGTLAKPFSVYNGVAQILSDDVKEKIRNTVKAPPQMDATMEEAKLSLLKLKGALK